MTEQKKRRGKREEHKQTASGLRHQKQRPADRKKTAELVIPIPPPHISLSSHLFSLCSNRRQTYFQSPGKSVDSSLFPLLGLLAGYPFQQT